MIDEAIWNSTGNFVAMAHGMESIDDFDEKDETDSDEERTFVPTPRILANAQKIIPDVEVGSVPENLTGRMAVEYLTKMKNMAKIRLGHSL